MKTLLNVFVFVVFSTLVFADSDTTAAAGSYKAYLSGWKEVPAVVSTGTGEFSAKIADDEKSIDVTLTLKQLAADAQEASLHLAQPGVNGPAVVTLCGGSHAACPKRDGTVSVTIKEADVTAAEAQGLAAGDLASLLAAMKNGVVYVNVTSAKFADGEIRGQVGRGMHGGPNNGDGTDQDAEDTTPPAPGNSGNAKGHGKGH